MADLSLDEIIASKKGNLNFTVQFTNKNVSRPFMGLVSPRHGFRPGGVQQKRPFLGQGLKARGLGLKSSAALNNVPVPEGPGKGQIDARDMITIRNRIKIPDARARILQKRLGKGTFDARSKLKASGPQQMVNRQVPIPAPMPLGGPHVNAQFQQMPNPQRFPVQGPNNSTFQATPLLRQAYPQPGPQFIRPPAQNLSHLQRPQYVRPAPVIAQAAVNNYNQQLPQFNHPLVGFSQPPLNFQQLPAQNDNGLINFTVAVTAGAAQSVAPFTRTLRNPLASGGALVEDTGESLKITRAVPDVTFDGQNLTVTRRLPPSKPVHMANKALESSLGSNPAKSMGNSSRGPVIQIENDYFQPTPIQAPGLGVMLRTRLSAVPNQPRRAPSPIQAPAPTPAPTPKRLATRPPATVPAQTNPAPAVTAPSPGYVTNTRYKTVKTPPAAIPVQQPTLPSAPTAVVRQRSAPSGSVPAAASKRTAQSALSRIQIRVSENSPAVEGLATTSSLSATKRLGSRQPSSLLQQEAESLTQQTATATAAAVAAAAKAGVKRKVPMSLSERFGAAASGNPIPVITDLAPAKKKRAPEPEPEGPTFEEDFELKEQFEEDVVEQEENPAVPLLSPLQGFRILVSNLHTSVTQDDIIELFGAIGPLKRANLLARGQAEVAFIHKEHAVMALKKYHNRELDGQPMFVKLLTPLNAKVMKPPGTEDSPGLPAALRTKKTLETPSAAPVEIPLIHKALFKTGGETGASKSVCFTVKL